MVSKDGEEVQFPAPFLFYASTRGAESWLAGLLEMTKDAVRTIRTFSSADGPWKKNERCRPRGESRVFIFCVCPGRYTKTEPLGIGAIVRCGTL